MKGPLYAQVAEKLRSMILSERWLPGTKLPPERVLVERFRVSRLTLRRSLDILAEERLLSRRHGSGTYVAPPEARRIPLQINYTTSMIAHAPGLRRSVLDYQRVPANGETVARLDVSLGTRLRAAERLDRLGSDPVAYDQAWIVPERARHLTRRTMARVDFVEAWTAAEGFRVAECRQIIEAVEAPPPVAKRLGLRAGEPVLRSTEIYLEGHARPAGLFISWYHPGRICIEAAYEWPPSASAPRHEPK